MADPLGVTPDGVRSVAKDVGIAGSDLDRAMSSLLDKLAAFGTAWGDSKDGHQFADGPNGYLAQVEWVKDNITAKRDLLRAYQESLKTAADTLEQQDES
jgi:phage-related minor tail protein